jgi:hypothetical protein
MRGEGELHYHFGFFPELKRREITTAQEHQTNLDNLYASKDDIMGFKILAPNNCD